ncbi:MAG: GlsB/YeaQ/YmgE family stress response membrane protein [Bdellovibrionota bacterium]
MIWALLVGLVVGAIAKFIMPGKDPGGIIVTMLLGIGGAMLAHFIGTSTGSYRSEEPVGLLGAVLGSIVILIIYRIIVRKRV